MKMLDFFSYTLLTLFWSAYADSCEDSLARYATELKDANSLAKFYFEILSGFIGVFSVGNSSSVATAVTCENFWLGIACPPPSAIKIVSANYGRTDRSTCIKGIHSSYTNNIGCDNWKQKALNTVTAKCAANKNICYLTASNAEFGDPCYLTYKYLRVDYKCEL